MIKITSEAIDESGLLQSIKSETCGAAVLFVGTTRKFTTDGDQTRETTKLDYDCYEEMAVKVFGELENEARNKWPIENCGIIHRVGVVELGETSIAIGISSPHRSDAFAAAQWLMDEIKKKVPIWKRENWADGTTEWVHPGVKPVSVPPTMKGES